MSHLPSIIVFDAFGTLVHITEKRAPYKKLLMCMNEQGRPYQANDSHTIMANDIDLKNMVNLLGYPIPDDFLTTLEQDLKDEIESVKRYDDTLATIEYLQHIGCKVAICSNLATPYGSIVQDLVPGLDAYFFSYEIGAIKPAPQIYQAILDKFNCTAQDVLFIGDTPLADVEGPTQFGMSARLINRKQGQLLKNVLKQFEKN